MRGCAALKYIKYTHINEKARLYAAPRICKGNTEPLSFSLSFYEFLGTSSFFFFILTNFQGTKAPRIDIDIDIDRWIYILSLIHI